MLEFQIVYFVYINSQLFIFFILSIAQRCDFRVLKDFAQEGYTENKNYPDVKTNPLVVLT